VDTMVKAATTPEMKCEVCGSSEHTRVPAPWEILRCSECGLTYAPQTGTEDSPDLYDESFAKASKHPTYIFDGAHYAARATEVWSEHLARLRPYRETGRILDIGCSLGFLLHQAQELGWEAHGVEVSEYAVKHAREKFGVRVVQGILEEDTYPNGFFDAVICSHVMEHVPSPRTLLRQIRKILRPGGVALILVPTQFASLTYRILGRVRGVGPPLHLYFFSRGTLSSLLGQEGFSVVGSEMNTELAHLVGALIRSKRLENKLEEESEQIVSRPSQSMGQYARKFGVKAVKTLVNRLGTAFDFGDELVVYAEKSRTGV
jgi:2-polyprenyl-3-methyl-5-hydroxy-6-metoxy-1,4-benzoquinol methylase